MNQEKQIKTILTLISHFLDGKKVVLSSEQRKDSTIIHYYTEIVRYWSSLNYISKKVFRSMNLDLPHDKYQQARYLYGAYRYIWEGAELKELYPDKKLLDGRFYTALRSFSLQKAISEKSPQEKLSISEAIPNFFIDRLSNVMATEDIKVNVEAMNKIPQFFTIFVEKNVENTLNLCFINSLQKDINKNEQIFLKDSDLPYIYNVLIKHKKEILNSELYKEGKIIILDKASAVVVSILDPRPNEIICDMCAAPGIKTSLISHFTGHKASIISGEFLFKRMKILKSFANQLKNNYLHLINCDSIVLPIKNDIKFDKVLLDAPCTGSGTFLSNPELKWRQNEKFLHQNMLLQEKLLKSALSLLKPSGILVYSTCSLYPEEGEYQIFKVIDDLEPMRLPNWIADSYKINDKLVPGTGRLTPEYHQTQGFFIGKFRKKAKVS